MGLENTLNKEEIVKEKIEIAKIHIGDQSLDISKLRDRDRKTK